jgi:hypothetical protein
LADTGSPHASTSFAGSSAMPAMATLGSASTESGQRASAPSGSWTAIVS